MARLTTNLASISYIALSFIATAAVASSYPVAGIHPDKRPEAAPTITQVSRDSQWYRQALHGVIPPYPASLKFLEDQGNWYTPFIHPGMKGPYDIRGWHK